MIQSILFAIENKKCLIAVTKERAIRIEPYAYGMDLEGSQALIYKLKDLENGELKHLKISDILGIHIMECEFVIQYQLAEATKQHFNFVFSSLLMHTS